MELSRDMQNCVDDLLDVLADGAIAAAPLIEPHTVVDLAQALDRCQTHRDIANTFSSYIRENFDQLDALYLGDGEYPIVLGQGGPSETDESSNPFELLSYVSKAIPETVAEEVFSRVADGIVALFQSEGLFSHAQSILGKTEDINLHSFTDYSEFFAVRCRVFGQTHAVFAVLASGELAGSRALRDSLEVYARLIGARLATLASSQWSDSKLSSIR